MMKYILTALFGFLFFSGYSQQYKYNPAIAGTTSNKPYAPAQASPTDSRSYIYDSLNFRWRPYVSTEEVLQYLYLPKYRVGQFDIVVNTGGVLSNGQIIGGTNAIWYFKDGTDDDDLVLKTVSASESRYVERTTADSLRLVDVDTAHTYRLISNGMQVEYYYDPSDNSSADDGVMILIANNEKRLKRLFYGPVNARWFGAIPDNETDCKSAIQKAVDYAYANGIGSVYIPGSQYKYILQSSVNLKTGITIFGEGDKTVIEQGDSWLDVAPLNFGLFNIYEHNSIIIRGIKFKGRWIPDPPTYPTDVNKWAKLIYGHNADSISIIQCYFDSSNYEGIWQGGKAEDCNVWTVKDNFFNAVGTPNSFIGLPALQLNVSNSIVTGNTFSGCGIAIGSTGPRHVIQSNKILFPTYYGIQIGDQPTIEDSPQDGIYSGNSIYVNSSYFGINYDQNFNTQNHIYGNTVVLNSSSDNAEAYRLSGSGSLDFSDNIAIIVNKGIGVSVRGAITSGDFFNLRTNGNTVVKKTRYAGYGFVANNFSNTRMLNIYQDGDKVLCDTPSTATFLDYNYVISSSTNKVYLNKILSTGFLGINGPDGNGYAIEGDPSRMGRPGQPISLTNQLVTETNTALSVGKMVLDESDNLSISNDVINIVGGSGYNKTKSYIKILPQITFSPDSVQSITGVSDKGYLLVIRGSAQYSNYVNVRFRSGVGNLRLAHNSDFIMDEMSDRLTLLFDGTNWSEVSRSVSDFTAPIGYSSAKNLSELGDNDFITKSNYKNYYVNSTKDLLHRFDTVGVKIVKSFHEGYSAGGFSAIYVSGGTPDYITSWPSKFFSGVWRRTDFLDFIDVEQLGALGFANVQVSAAALGYSDDDLADLYGTYTTKNTADYIDEIALNQLISAIGQGYRNLSLGNGNEYNIFRDLREFPLFGVPYQTLTIEGNGSTIRCRGGRYKVLWKYPEDFSTANIEVQCRYVINRLRIENADTAIAINPSYQSVINGCKFRTVNVGVVARWDMAINITNCSFDSFDGIGIMIDRLPVQLQHPQSNYFVMRNNKFVPTSDAKYSIYVFRSNGGLIEHTIFEGGNPTHNLWVDMLGGNNREMKITSVHCENFPDSSHIFFRGSASHMYLDKWYLQTDAITIDAGNSTGNDNLAPVNIYFNDIPYWGGIPSFRHSGGASWFFTNSQFINLKDTAIWADGVFPTYTSGSFVDGAYKNNGVLSNFKGNIESYSQKIQDGASVFNGSLRVPSYTDSTIDVAQPGRIYYHNTRSKFYGGFGSSWRPIIDSVTLYHPTATATANGQTLTAFSFAPTFNAGGFTGLAYRMGAYQAAISGNTVLMYLANSSSTANSKMQLQLLSNAAAGSGGGVMNIYNDGLIAQTGSNVPLTLQASATGGSVIFKPQSATKGTWNSTGLRIGDATAPITDFEVAGVGAWLLSRGTTAQRPTGVSGYFRSNSDSSYVPEFFGNSNWHLLATRTWVRDSLAELRSAISSGGTNIYNSDGTIPSTRLVTLGSNSLRLGYDASTYGSFSVSSGGDMSITGTNGLILGTFRGGSTSANFAVAGTFNAPAESIARFQIGGASITHMRIGEASSSGQVLGVGNAYGSHIIGTQTLTEASSGVHPLLSQLAIKSLSVTGAAGTVTDAATVWIEGASNASVTGFNDAFRVASGNARFGGDINLVGDLRSYQSGAIYLSTGHSFSTGQVQPLFRNGSTGRVEIVSLSEAFGSTTDLSLQYGGDVTFSGGSPVVYTLPVADAQKKGRYFAITIKNRGSANITVNSNAGGNDIYTTVPTNTITILPGESVWLLYDTVYWNVE